MDGWMDGRTKLGREKGREKGMKGRKEGRRSLTAHIFQANRDSSVRWI